MAGWLFVISLIVALVVVYRPFGDYMYRVVTGAKSSRAERGIYRLVGVNPAAEGNTQTVSTLLQVWAHGGNGFLPWQTLGNDASLDTDDNVAGSTLMVPGTRFGVPVVGARGDDPRIERLRAGVTAQLAARATNPLPPRGTIMSMSPAARSIAPTASRSCVGISCTASAGRSVSTSAASISSTHRLRPA